jgi:hypothetical protein
MDQRHSTNFENSPSSGVTSFHSTSSPQPLMLNSFQNSPLHGEEKKSLPENSPIIISEVQAKKRYEKIVQR